MVGVLGKPHFVRPTLTCPHFLQGSPEGSAVKDFVLKHSLPLVGHRKPSNDAKRYTRRPLVVVYYSVDFSFDYRAGEGPRPLWVGGQECVCFMASGHCPSVLQAAAYATRHRPPGLVELLTKVPCAQRWLFQKCFSLQLKPKPC